MTVIAISGGIGSGKSVVCRVLEVLGYPVYDCDSHARDIMDSSTQIKHKIAKSITERALNTDGTLNRTAISEIVFSDSEKLKILNEIVHEAVRADLKSWIKSQCADKVFVETAILYQSGLDRMVDQVWEVIAPDNVRIDRVCQRNGFTPEQVKSRMDSQLYIPDVPHQDICCIINDGNTSVLLQINSLLNK